MINYFALAFRNLLIVRFAMKNQNWAIEHLLSRCKVSSEFWNDALSWLKGESIIIGLFLGNLEKNGRFLYN